MKNRGRRAGRGGAVNAMWEEENNFKNILDNVHRIII